METPNCPATSHHQLLAHGAAAHGGVTEGRWASYTQHGEPRRPVLYSGPKPCVLQHRGRSPEAGMEICGNPREKANRLTRPGCWDLCGFYCICFRCCEHHRQFQEHPRQMVNPTRQLHDINGEYSVNGKEMR